MPFSQSAAPADQLHAEVTKIFVTGLRVEAEIGVHKHEFGKAQPLIVDVELDVPGVGFHHLADTLNYEGVLKAARDVAAAGHIHLVETFAERMARACFADARVVKARIRVEKPLALAPDAAGAGVDITFVRG